MHSPLLLVSAGNRRLAAIVVAGARVSATRTPSARHRPARRGRWRSAQNLPCRIATDDRFSAANLSSGLALPGRVEMWRGSSRSGLSVVHPFRLAVPQ